MEHDLILVDELLVYEGPTSKEMMVEALILTKTKAEGSCTLQVGSHTNLTSPKVIMGVASCFKRKMISTLGGIC